jgi:hypothetical protein
MIYQCQKCGLSKFDSATGSVLPQCKCDWNAPPAAQRQWVGLTDEEVVKAMPGGIYDCLNDPWDCGVGDGDTLRSIKNDVLRIARAIEAKLRSKNGGDK